MIKRNVKLITALAVIASLGTIGTGFNTVNAASAPSNNTTKAVH